MEKYINILMTAENGDIFESQFYDQALWLGCQICNC